MLSYNTHTHTHTHAPDNYYEKSFYERREYMCGTTTRSGMTKLRTTTQSHVIFARRVYTSYTYIYIYIINTLNSTPDASLHALIYAPRTTVLLQDVLYTVRLTYTSRVVVIVSIGNVIRFSYAERIMFMPRTENTRIRTKRNVYRYSLAIISG